MAWLSDKSDLKFGKYKGKKVGEVNDVEYIEWLHKSKYNVYFKQSVFERLKSRGNEHTGSD